MFILSIAKDKKALNPAILDMRKISNFCDYFVIVEGESGRQLRAIADSIVEELEKNNIPVRAQEGKQDSGWLLVDTMDIMVHIFSSEARKFYDLERLWSDAKTVKLS
ncbi:MAG: ribosome silencing factor [Candidatus Omnitrophota bacterium]